MKWFYGIGNHPKNHLPTLRELGRLGRFFKPPFQGGDGVSEDTRLSLRSARSTATRTSPEPIEESIKQDHE